MKRLMRWFGRRGKIHGYTLIELSAVVAVTATLGAVVIPIAVDKAKEGKLIGAKENIRVIASAITSYHKDTGLWPSIGDTSSDYTRFDVLRSGSNTDGALASGAVVATPAGTAPHDPIIPSGSGWLTGTNNVAHMDSQFLIKPSGLTASSWKGPYTESLKKHDPWGNAYLVYMKAMHTASEHSAKRYGWIISAGPNGQIETNVNQSNIQGDDIGIMFYSNTTTSSE